MSIVLKKFIHISGAGAGADGGTDGAGSTNTDNNRLIDVDVNKIDNDDQYSAISKRIKFTTWKKLTHCFNCFLCGNYVFPPMSQCYRSHIFCQPCYDSWTKCPICFMDKTNARSPNNEAICRIMFFPCKYFFKGLY